MIDWHSHILPAVDDGSRDIEESLGLLHILQTSGVDTVIATPHFYADRISAEDFFAARDQSAAALRRAMPADAPNLLLGAEVRYYEGISRLENLKDFRIEGSRQLLLEMPVSHWSEYALRELVELAGTPGVELLLAHVERYRALQSDDAWERLLQAGIRMQSNASNFLSWRTRGAALRQLWAGEIHCIGSDCHNLKYRPPKIGEAYEWIAKKSDARFLPAFDAFGHKLLGH